ncbi:hypothetical protein SASPL_119786 [Salvia splendens]|uniref:Kinesin motor domain-containing protein n=1 Tax=Salvia splendens TaxID=180675 RepID=A0A8X8ZTE8_SALSN|nr:hypothetical protein SASPL_119786 [Salvia splendens]
MESTQRRGGGGAGGMVPISPSQTPRSSDKAGRDLRSGEGSFNGKQDKEKGVNVQVIVRCRPLSEDEARIHTPVVISCNDNKREVCAVQTIANKQIDRTFLFDKNGEYPSDAGVIPRAVRQIFDILEAQHAEYSMKVTFLELYNEEISDLLAPEETSKFPEDKSKKPIALMEDGKVLVCELAMSERIERMELDLDSRDKQLAELQDLYNSQQQSTAELSDKLEKTELFKGITSEADALLHDLQDSLQSQEKKLTAYAEQQREAHSRAVETTRSISQITVNFFRTLDGHASMLGQIFEEAQTNNDQKLSELEKKFEECAAHEEKQLLAKVAELLAGSNARKKKLVKCAIVELRESAASRTSKLQQEMSTMQETTGSIKAEWTSYTQSAESHYLEDTASVQIGKGDMEEVLRKCMEQAKLGAQQWKSAQESLLHLEKTNVASIDEIVRGGIDTIDILRGRFSSAVSSALEDTDTGSKNLLSSIDRSLQLDHEACGNLDSMIVPCCGDLRDLNSGHYHKIVEITENAGKCLLEEYTVDQPSCSTPKKRPINPSSVASIEELRTPSFEELLNVFWDAKSSKQANGDAKHILEAAIAMRDSRLPLTALN